MSSSKGRPPTENELASRALLTLDRTEGDKEFWTCRNCGAEDIKRGKNDGWTNTMSHLTKSYCYGSRERVLEVYKAALEARNQHGGSIMQFVNVQSLNQRQLCMYAWIRLIVLKSLPLSTIEDEEYRSALGKEYNFAIKTLKRVLFHLVVIVEENISKVLPEKGALLSDGWTQNTYHFVAVFASFIEEHKQMSGGVESIVEEPAIALLGVSTMDDIGFKDDDSDSEEDEPVEATTFTAEVHFDYMKSTLEYYDKSFDDFVVCLTADNASVNKRVGIISGKPLIGCR